MTRARDLGDFIADGGTPELVVDTTTLVVDSTNNRVGIGTASPNAPTSIVATTTTYEGLELITPTGDGSGEFHIGVHQNGSTGGRSIVFKRGGSDGMDTESMRIDSNGVVNVGTASGTQPSYFNSFLNVQNNGSTGSHASVTITSGSGGFAGLHFGDSDNGRIGQVTYNNSDNSLLLTANNSERFRIASAGQLGIAGANYGTSGQVLTSGGSGAAPTWADAAGGGGSFDAVASGTIANGALVSLNRDGTVTTTTQAVGNTTEFNSGSTDSIGAAFDSSANKIVVAYKDIGDSNKGKAVVGTISGDSITFGTPVVFNNSTAGGSTFRADFISVCYDPNANKTAIIFQHDGDADKMKGSVGTISGTSISFGTTATLDNSGVRDIDTVFDPDQNQIICVYTDKSNLNQGECNVLSISGTSISTSHVGTPFGSTTGEFPKVVYDTNANKAVFFAYDGNVAANAGRGRVVVGTNSGSAITFGSVTTYNATGTNFEQTSGSRQIGAAFDSTANKVVVAFVDNNDSDSGKAKVGTVSGTSITFGNTAKFNLGQTLEINATYDSTVNRTFITFRDSSNSNTGTVNAGFISGTDIFFSGEIGWIESSSCRENVIISDTNADRLAIFFVDGSDSSKGKAVVCNPVGVDNFLNWVGISEAAISNSATGTITVLSGVSENQSSLVIGAKHYLQDDATISTTEVTGREVGKALSATKLLITQGSIS